jgi:hypothetical protein
MTLITSPATSPALGNDADLMLLKKFTTPPAAFAPADAAAPAPAIVPINTSSYITLFI